MTHSLLTLCRRLIAGVVGMLWIAHASAQMAFPTPGSKQFVTQAELDSVLYRGVVSACADNETPELVAAQRFPAYREAIVQAATPLIRERFRRVEGRNKAALKSPNDPQLREAIRGDYFDEMRQMVARTIYQTPRLLPLLNFDPSDRIVGFHSKTQLAADGSLLVTEHIIVYNGDGQSNTQYLPTGRRVSLPTSNNEITRGIIRAFPVKYLTPEGLIWKAPFKVVSVLRNGQPEPHHKESYQNGILLYLGSSDVFLDKGIHQYAITYRTDWQVAHFEGFDQLAWNVTGNGWTFQIDSASWQVRLPGGALPDSLRCFTGPQGSFDANCHYWLNDSGTMATFATTRGLNPNEGLTASVNLPKGVVIQPSKTKYYLKLAWNNLFLVLGLLLLAVLVLFDGIAWWRIGKDPRSGTIIPQFSPPAHLSPAAMGYVYEQTWKDRFATATLVDAAIHKVLRISVKKEKGLFSTTSYSFDKSFATSESTSYKNYFFQAKDLIGTTISRGKYVSSVETFRNHIKKDLERLYRVDQQAGRHSRGLFALNSRIVGLGTALLMMAGASFFVYVVQEPGDEMLLKAGAMWLLGLLIHVFFARIMNAYTEEGREVADEIKGFRLFLVTADQRRFDALNPPELTLQLYEKYLPYALALGVENAWGEKFESVFAAQKLKSGSESYQSSWHNLNYRSMGSDVSRSFVSSMGGSFTGAISSSSTPPSSSGSSGSSSFGGSGGGGGGGGGSGW